VPITRVMKGCHRTPCTHGDSGFALVETLVSAVVLVVIALATLAAVDRAQSTSAIGKGRSVAASLAEQDQERLRALPATSLSTYPRNHAPTRPMVVGGLTYNVASSVDWVRDSTGGTPSCTSDDNSSQADYLKITSTVTGTGVRPITISSLVATPVAFSSTRGTLAVKVVDGGNQPVVGLAVSISGGASTTDSTNAAGCAVFAYIPAGAYHVRFSQSGWVDPTGASAVDATKQVNAGQVNLLPLTYDRAGAITVRFDTKVGSAAATTSWGWTASGMHTGVTGAGIRTNIGASAPLDHTQASVPVTDLFPFRTAYQTFAGECKGSNPATAIPSTGWYSAGGGGVDDVVIVPPGDTSSAVIVRQPALGLKVTNGSAALPAANVVLTVKDATCITPPAPVRLGGLTTNSAGMVTKSDVVAYDPGVPFGVYDICADAVTGSGTGAIRRYKIKTGVAVNNAAGVTVADLAIPTTGTGSSVAGTC
jgi:Tfp pilus assembly protein PilV